MPAQSTETQAFNLKKVYGGKKMAGTALDKIRYRRDVLEAFRKEGRRAEEQKKRELESKITEKKEEKEMSEEDILSEYGSKYYRYMKNVEKKGNKPLMPIPWFNADMPKK